MAVGIGHGPPDPLPARQVAHGGKPLHPADGPAVAAKKNSVTSVRRETRSERVTKKKTGGRTTKRLAKRPERMHVFRITNSFRARRI